MKKIIFCLSFLLLAIISFCQNKIVRSTGSNTLEDGRVIFGKNLITPRYLDTTEANTIVNLGLDSASAIIFTYKDNAHWYRQFNPKKWVLVGEKLNFINGLTKTGQNVSAEFNSAIWNANKLQGFNISSTAPSDTFVLTYNAAAGRWEPAPPRGSGGGGGGSDGNNFSSGIDFDPATGIFTNQRTGLTDLTESLDGRYLKYSDTTTVSLGVVRATALNIIGDGNDQTTKINTALANTNVKELIFDDYTFRDITISGVVTVPAGKIIRFANGNRIIGTGSWNGGLILANIYSQCFGNTGYVINLENNDVYITWFGAIANNSTDCAPAFRKARDAISKIIISGGPGGTTTMTGSGTIRVPRGHYYSDSVWFDKSSISVIGMGTGLYPTIETRIRFPQDRAGFKFVRYPTGNPGCVTATIENLYLYAGGGASSMDTTAHGIEANCVLNIRRVETDAFGGHGVFLNTSGIGLPPGNSSNSIVENHTAFYNRLNGMYVRGEESSNIHFRNCDWRTNGGSNFLDCGFLGNLVENCHVASNGFRPGGLGVVSYNGNYYASIKDIPGVSENINKEPGAVGSEDWWQLVNGFGYDGVGFSRVWNNATRYPMSVPYGVGSVPAKTTFLHCYSEGGTAGVSLNTFSIVISGDIGTGMARPWMNEFTPSLGKTLSRASMWVPNTTSGDSSFAELSAIYGQAVGRRNNAGSDVIKGALKYNQSNKQIEFFTDASVGNRSLAFNTSETDPTNFGLTAIKTGGLLIDGVKGFYIPDQGNSARIRNWIAGLIPPIAAEHVAGDWVHYSGTDSTIAGYRVTATGTPGTYQTIRTGSGAWNLYNTDGTVTSNRLALLNNKTFTIRDSTAFNQYEFKKYRYQALLVGKHYTAQNYSIVTQDTSFFNVAVHDATDRASNLQLYPTTTGLGNNSNILLMSNLNTTSDSILFLSYQGRAIFQGGITGNKLVIGEQSSLLGSTRFLLQTNNTPIAWNRSSTNEFRMAEMSVEALGKMILDGELETNYLQQPSLGLGIWVVGSDTLKQSSSLAHSSYANFGASSDNKLIAVNKFGQFYKTTIDPNINNYISKDITYDSIASKPNDSTLLLKSIRVVAGANITVTPTITASTISYSIAGSGGGGGGTVTDFSFTNGDAFTGVVATSTTTPTLSLKLDSTLYTTRLWHYKGIDSMKVFNAATYSAVAHTHTFASLTSKPTTLSGYGITDAQPLDADLTTIAGLTATTDNFMQSKAGAWASRTIAQVKTDLGLTGTNSGDQTITLTGDVTGSGTGSFAATIAANAVTFAKMQAITDNRLLGANGGTVVEEISLTASDFDFAANAISIDYTNGQAATGSVKGFLTAADWTTFNSKQAGDADLTTIAGLTATTDNFLVSVSSAWASRTPAQVKTTLSLNNVENTALSTWAGTTNITTVGADAITYSEIQNVSATSRIMGRITGGAGDMEELTGTQATNLLDTTLLSTRLRLLKVVDSSLNATSFTIRNSRSSGDSIMKVASASEVIMKRLIAGSNITITPGDSSITIASSGGGSGDMVLASVQTVTGAKTFGTIGGAVGKFILAGSTSGSTILNAAAVAGSTTITLPGSTGTVVLNSISNTYTAGAKQIFSESATTAGLNFAGVSLDVTSPANGDVWFQTTNNIFRYRADGTTRTFANLDEAQAFTNKTIAFGSNTLSGTTAQFNTALSDNDFATLAGTETLTNKSLTSPTLTGTPTTPTAAAGTNSTQIASTAFALANGGYTINVQALTSTIADAVAHYFGALPIAPTTVAGAAVGRTITIQKAGTIRIAEIYSWSTTIGTNESWSMYIRLNNTTDYLIATVSAATGERIWSNTGLSIAVVAGDYFEIKSNATTWATNPVTIFGGYVYVE